MNRAAKHYALARADVLRRYPDIADDPEELESEIRELLSDWAADEAADREMFGGPDEAESVANCDDWGTGEGRFHGRI